MQLDEKISPIFDLIFFTFLRQYQGGPEKNRHGPFPSSFSTIQESAGREDTMRSRRSPE